MNTLQYYGYYGSILEFAAEHKDDYAGDLIATSLLYAFQYGMPDDDRFMSYEDVEDADAPFNNHLKDTVNNLS